MSKLIINSYKELEACVGKELDPSDYLQITQERINLFADATSDHQWIHTDPEKAKTESPYQKTIAHGYLTLSLLPYLWDQIIKVNNLKMMINYEVQKARFNQAVVVDSEIRLKAKFISVVNLRGITKTEIQFVIEIKDSKKNALEGTAVFLYNFNE